MKIKKKASARAKPKLTKVQLRQKEELKAFDRWTHNNLSSRERNMAIPPHDRRDAEGIWEMTGKRSRLRKDLLDKHKKENLKMKKKEKK